MLLESCIYFNLLCTDLAYHFFFILLLVVCIYSRLVCGVE